MHTKSWSFSPPPHARTHARTHTHTHTQTNKQTYTRVGSNCNNKRLAENNEVNSDPYHTVSKRSTVEEITHHRKFPKYILSKKLRKRKSTRVTLTRHEYLTRERWRLLIIFMRWHGGFR